jgi:signal transduction histidine kinase
MIVELMGGSISLESEDGQGSRFTIKLKMKVAKPEQTQKQAND